MKEGAPGSSVAPAGKNVLSDAAEPENRICGECGATVPLRQARVKDLRPDAGIGIFRGLLAALVMTAFFGLLVLVGFALGKLS